MIEKPKDAMSRRHLLAALPAGGAAALVLSLATMQGVWAADSPAGDRFDFLSANGNSNCSSEFLNSIARMPADARLQGSCCSPMDRTSYLKQLRGLRKFAAIAEIPPDPYDIVAGLAQRLMGRYDDVLTASEQRSYQFAMDHSREKGPCCCECWRWQLYGGLAKLLIRERHFSGPQIVEVWNLSDGCGGT